MGLRDRIRRIQREVGVEPDGLIGVDTVSALERALGIVPAPAAPTDSPPVIAKALTLSRQGLEELIAHEIGSEAYYVRHLERPVWPGGASGVTIGIGYDLGYRSRTRITNDWNRHLSEQTISHLKAAAGIRGENAKGVARSLRQAGVSVPLDAAKEVFWSVTLPEYAVLARKTYPGVDELPPDAQAALVSLIYNRGSSLKGAARREMATIKGHVKQQDLESIAAEIESMKRLWVDKGLDGLLKRRDREARLVRESRRTYEPDELIYV